MSKTSQRNASAYANGYRAGRYGLWAPNGYRLSVQSVKAFRRGREHGRHDRLAALRIEQSLSRRVLSWLKRLVSQ